jgi:predicted transcriptional regulator with HTH domain
MNTFSVIKPDPSKTFLRSLSKSSLRLYILKVLYFLYEHIHMAHFNIYSQFTVAWRITEAFRNHDV